MYLDASLCLGHMRIHDVFHVYLSIQLIHYIFSKLCSLTWRSKFNYKDHLFLLNFTDLLKLKILSRKRQFVHKWRMWTDVTLVSSVVTMNTHPFLERYQAFVVFVLYSSYIFLTELALNFFIFVWTQFWLTRSCSYSDLSCAALYLKHVRPNHEKVTYFGP